MYDDVCKAMAKQAVALEVRMTDNAFSYLILKFNYTIHVSYNLKIKVLYRKCL